MSPTALPSLLRYALLATAAMNVIVGLAFASGSTFFLETAGLPAGVPAFYTMTVGLFVCLFGIGYYGAAVAPRPERLMIALGGFGKLGFVAVVTGLWIAGSLPPQAVATAAADLPFGILFVAWFLGSRGAD